VIERQSLRHRRIEIARERSVHDVAAKAGVACQHGMIEARFQERLGRAVVLLANADAECREIVEEEIAPVIRRHDDQDIRPRHHQAMADLRKALFDEGPRRR